MHEWLITHRDIDKWALSRFPFKRWDNITTNIAESFNAWMLDKRRHNVSVLIHEHREKVANKMYATSLAMSKWKNGIGPRIEAKIKEHVNVGISSHLTALPHGDDKFGIRTVYGRTLAVDLRAGTCTCAAWQQSGIPCPHVCVAIKHFHGNVYEYVNECYKVTSQQRIYRSSMIPVVTIDMPDLNNIDVSLHPLLKPPITSRPSGRPKIKRRESQFQDKKIYHCVRCHEVGHTRRT